MMHHVTPLQRPDDRLSHLRCAGLLVNKALVPTEGAEKFLEEWRSAYHAEMPKWADSSNFFQMSPCEGSFRIELERNAL